MMDVLRPLDKAVPMNPQAAGAAVVVMIVAMIVSILQPRFFIYGLHRNPQRQRHRNPPRQSRHDVTEHLPFAIPPMATVNEAVENAPQPVCMAESLFNIVRKEIHRQTWVKEKFVRINRDTNTISLFEKKEAGTGKNTTTKSIPLFYHGIPVILHEYNPSSADVCPIKFDAMETTPSALGLLRCQLESLYRHIPGIEFVEFYVDREVVITVASSFLVQAIEIVGSRVFRAWQCNFILTQRGGLQTVVPDEKLSDEDETFLEDINSDADITLSPGHAVYNSNGQSSTLGVLLHPGPLGKKIQIKYFTVSAHSFMQKLQIHLWPVNILSMLVMSFVSGLAWLGGKDNWFEPILLKQYFFVRTFILAYTVFWQFTSKAVGMNKMVNIVPADLTSSREVCNSFHQSQFLE